MSGWLSGVLSVVFVLANAFFVVGEYAIVSVRRSSIESLARRRRLGAQAVAELVRHLDRSVAALQFGITLCGIAIGAVTEPALTRLIEPYLQFLPITAVRIVSVLAVSFPLVVLGELVPKFLVVRAPERWALAVGGTVGLFVRLVSPFVWLFQSSANLVLRAFGARPDTRSNGMSREELALIFQSSGEEGAIEKDQASVLARALRLDQLQSDDVMVHRLDVNWIDVEIPSDELLAKLAAIPHSRVPVCRGGLDDVEGIVYVQDALRAHLDGLPLTAVLRPAEFVPEALTLDRAIQRMRESRTQILLVRDEYGGTAGLLTLEDIVEEVFGELEDSLEGERPAIEAVALHRLSARADTRYDELLEFLQSEADPNDLYTTETLAEIVVNGLGRVPRLGDSVETRLGRLLVENMARRRVTRVGLIRR